MCFNYKVSLFTFLLGTFFSIILINYGNNKYKIENKITGIFLIFISGIQFMDFLFWIDIHNKYGINHITTMIGPIFNVGQPVILYILKLLYYKPKQINLPLHFLNLFYVIYMCNMYFNFISNEKLITSVNHGNLEWKWLKYSNKYFYLILFAINIFYLFHFNYSFLLFSITYLFLYISATFFKYNIGEIWCFFGSFIPLCIFTITKLSF